MTTLMSSGVRSRACWKLSGFSRRVIRRPSHARSASASAWDALYQWRLFAFTLPTSTLLFRTSFAAMSATVWPAGPPPPPTPVRHRIPPAPIFWTASASTDPTPVHSTMTSGSKPRSRTLPEW